MRPLQVLTTITLMLAFQGAQAACALLRFGFVDQHRPPYYLGNGPEEGKPPGATVELLRENAAAAGCPVQTVRLPVPRVRQSLELGLIDAAPIDAVGNDTSKYVFPLDKLGNPNKDRAFQLVTIVFVRAKDKLPKDTQPLSYFKDKRLGSVHGAAYAEQLRKAGIEVDDGALDANRNLEKLMRGRIDGFAVALTSAHDMDSYVEQRFGKDIVRLEVPLRTTHVWLAFNKTYYANNREHIEAMWVWFEKNGRRRFNELLKIYDKER
jgi:polar amino acid transport system substrate-binding protein